MNEKIVREALKNCLKDDYTYCQTCPYEPFEEKVTGGCMMKMIEDTCQIFSNKDSEIANLTKEINQLKEVIKAKEVLINILNKCYAKSVADACDRMVELLSEKAEVDEHNDWWIELPAIHEVAHIIKKLYKNETNNN